MQILRTILTILFVIDCIALTVVVLMQEGKSQGLGAIAGAADTYWEVRTKDVPWRAVLLRQLQLWEFCSLYWQLY